MRNTYTALRTVYTDLLKKEYRSVASESHLGKERYSECRFNVTGTKAVNGSWACGEKVSRNEVVNNHCK